MIIQGPESKNKANQKQTSDQITQIVSGGGAGAGAGAGDQVGGTSIITQNKTKF